MAFLFTKKFYCCLIVFAALSTHAQTKFSASATPAQVGRDEYITLKLTVANGNTIQKIQPPSLEDFAVLSGPNTETEMNSVNGVTQQYQSLTYILLPKKRGKISIGAGTAIVDGKTFRSNPLTVTVTDKRSARPQNNNPMSMMQVPPSFFDLSDMTAPQEQYNDYVLHKGESIPDKVNKNMQLRLQTDKTSCYVGEPILATYKLYTRLQSESSLSKNPSFNGFSVVDMTQADPDTHTKESLNGRPCNVYIIRKAQLYPLQPGPVTLETATLDNKLQFLRAEDQSAVTQNVSLSSKPLIINVKPLPDAGKPANFKGAVGNFTIESSLAKKDLSTDEAGKLIITISGKGNMQLLTNPEISWPAGLEAFDIKSTDNTDKTTVPLSGNKTFEVPFSADRPGDYTVPAVSFSFFDPAAETYKTITAPAIPFHVSPGTGKKMNIPLPEIKQEPQSLLNSFFERRWLIIIFLAGMIITGIIVWMSREKKEEEKVIEQAPAPEIFQEPVYPAMPTVINPLAKTEDCLSGEDCVQFYSVLNGEMRQFLATKFALDPDRFTVKTLVVAMDRAGVDNDIILRTQTLIQEIEWQLYTPFEHDEKLHRMYADAQTIIGSLNTPVV